MPDLSLLVKMMTMSDEILHELAVKYQGDKPITPRQVRKTIRILKRHRLAKRLANRDTTSTDKLIAEMEELLVIVNIKKKIYLQEETE